MNKTYLTLTIVAILIVGIAGFYIYSSNLKSEWAINMASLPQSGANANCVFDPNYVSNQSTEDYLSSADYILTVKVLSLKETKIDDNTGKRDLYFEILNWEKGELSFVPNKLRISTDYNPSLYGVEGDTPFSVFKEGESYKIHLENINGQISFLGDDSNPCVNHGIIKL